MKTKYFIVLLFVIAGSSTGCLLAAGAAGAEGGYVVAQDDRTAGETIDDQVLLASVKSKLLADSQVSGFDINVDVFKGVVTLRGYMKTQMEIDRAVEIAGAVKGVKTVDSRLVLDRK